MLDSITRFLVRIKSPQVFQNSKKSLELKTDSGITTASPQGRAILLNWFDGRTTQETILEVSRG